MDAIGRSCERAAEGVSGVAAKAAVTGDVKLAAAEARFRRMPAPHAPRVGGILRM
jgi:hypothetical protein